MLKFDRQSGDRPCSSSVAGIPWRNHAANGVGMGFLAALLRRLAKPNDGLSLHILEKISGRSQYPLGYLWVFNPTAWVLPPLRKISKYQSYN